MAPACGGSSSPPGSPNASPSGAATASADRFFPPGSPWYQEVSAAALDAESPRVIAFLDAAGWGTGAMRIDFSIEVLEAVAQTTAREFRPTSDFYTPDCDLVPVPVPDGGALEGETGYACEGDGDCHLIVVDRPRMRLFEMWRADIRGSSSFDGGCLAVWDMTRVYPPSGRGERPVERSTH